MEQSLEYYRYLYQYLLQLQSQSDSLSCSHQEADLLKGSIARLIQMVSAQIAEIQNENQYSEYS